MIYINIKFSECNLWFLISLFIILVGTMNCTHSLDKKDINTEEYWQKQTYNPNISLGQYLFFDKMLSYNGEIACASCHNPNLSFTDGYIRSFNSKADLLEHNSPSLLNLSNYSFFSWTDTSIQDLDMQMHRPLFGTKPIEIGLHLDSTNIFKKLSLKYNEPINKDIIISSIRQYIEGLNARNSIYDQHISSNVKLSSKANMGKTLFYNKEINCNNCHGGIDFNTPSNGSPIVNFNNKKIRIPSLRNVSVTAPYLHNGNANSLFSVIKDHNSDKNNALDIRYPNKKLNNDEISNIIHFLYTLTDTSFKNNIYFQNPFYKND